ncbi:MAG: glycosyltransferase family 4 protein [Alphaproteobacteria bacterium]
MDRADAPRIRVSHPGATGTAYALAAALMELAPDARLWTGAYALPGPQAAAGRLPGAIGRRLARELGRRFDPRIDAARVDVRPLAELVHVGLGRLGLPEAWHPPLRRWRDRRFERHVVSMIDRDRPDVLVGHDGSTLGAFRHARRRGVTTVLHQAIGHIRTGARLLAEEARLQPDFADTLRLGIAEDDLQRSSAEAAEADWVLAASDYVRDSLVENGVDPRRIQSLPYTVDTDRFVPGTRAPDGRFRVLFVGQIGQRKGIKYLLEAVRRLDLPDLELLLIGRIIGSGAGLAPYRPWFRHVPAVPHGEVAALFRSADAFALPSLHEGSAMVTYEALAAGLPLVVSPNAGAPVRDGIEGFLVPIRDPDAIADRLRQLHGNPDLRAAMAVRARARALEFAWEPYRARVETAMRAWR